MKRLFICLFVCFFVKAMKMMFITELVRSSSLNQESQRIVPPLLGVLCHGKVFNSSDVTLHRGAIFQCLFRWIHYCQSGLFIEKKTDKTHLCALH